MSKIIRILLAHVLVVGLQVVSGCGSEEKFMIGEFDRNKAEETKKLILAELRIGSNTEEIESFFIKHNITYAYDEFSERYQAIIRNIPGSERTGHAVVIYIYVDKDMRFVSSEVRDSFR